MYKPVDIKTLGQKLTTTLKVMSVLSDRMFRQEAAETPVTCAANSRQKLKMKLLRKLKTMCSLKSIHFSVFRQESSSISGSILNLLKLRFVPLTDVFSIDSVTGAHGYYSI